MFQEKFIFCCFNEEGGIPKNGQVILIDRNDLLNLNEFMNDAHLETYTQGHHKKKFDVEKQNLKNSQSPYPVDPGRKKISNSSEPQLPKLSSTHSEFAPSVIPIKQELVECLLTSRSN